MIAASWTSARGANALSDTASPQVRVFREHDFGRSRAYFLSDSGHIVCFISLGEDRSRFFWSEGIALRSGTAVSITRADPDRCCERQLWDNSGRPQHPSEGPQWYG